MPGLDYRCEMCNCKVQPRPRTVRDRNEPTQNGFEREATLTAEDQGKKCIRTVDFGKFLMCNDV